MSSMDLSHFDSSELTALIDDARALIAQRAEADGARIAVADAITAYASVTGITVLQAWRELAPEGDEVPDGSEPEPTPDAPAYVPPSGAHDAYSKGDLVTFQGTVYRCLINGCIWSPLAYPQAWEVV